MTIHLKNPGKNIEEPVFKKLGREKERRTQKEKDTERNNKRKQQKKHQKKKQQQKKTAKETRKTSSSKRKQKKHQKKKQQQKKAKETPEEKAAGKKEKEKAKGKEKRKGDKTMKPELKLAPSMLSADFTCLGKELEDVKNGGAHYLHIDVMDGLFVPSISFGMPVIKSIRKATDMFFDVHLMIIDPIRYIKEFAESGADLITFHLEAAEDPQAVIDEIRKYNCKVGVSIKPKTPFEDVAPFMDKVDMLLVMTVEPGFGGQKMMPETLVKVREARDFVTENGLTTDIQVDGGVKFDNIFLPLKAGANVFVAGSAVFGPDTLGETKRFCEYLSRH